MDPARRTRFEAIVTEVMPALERYLRRRTADADDVLADTLLVLWRRLDDVPADAALPYAYGVAQRCLLNARRGRERHWRLVNRLAREPEAPPPTADPDLWAALARLPDTDREVLQLWAWEGLAPREIAVVLGITANAASIRLHRATTKLRTHLLPQEHPRKDPGSPGQEQGRQGQEAPR